MADLLNLTEAPSDPVYRLQWLSTAERKFKAELDAARQVAAFEARLQSRLPEVFALKLHPEKKIYAWTRAENEARGRMVRWTGIYG